MIRPARATVQLNKVESLIADRSTEVRIMLHFR